MGTTSQKRVAEMNIDELEDKIRKTCAKNVGVDPEVCRDCKGCSYGCNLIELLKEDYSFKRFDQKAVAKVAYEMEKGGADRDEILKYLKNFYVSPNDALVYIQQKRYPEFEKVEKEAQKKEASKPVEIKEEVKEAPKKRGRQPKKVEIMPKDEQKPERKSRFKKHITMEGEFASYMADGENVTIRIAGQEITLPRITWNGFGEELIDALAEI